MNTVKIRNVELGRGVPKICVPLTGRTREEIFIQARQLMGDKAADLAEWRADWYEGLQKPGEMIRTLEGLRSILGEIPVLFTIRTRKEGGALEVSPREYLRLTLEAIDSGLIDLADGELFMGDEILGQLISRARESRVRVIASNHDFEKTPGLDEILARLHHMDRLGADILKIALMPRSADDVLTLLAATREMSARGSSRPLITMSMSGQGLISRLSGEFFGSCLTFGCLEGAPSAPGQIPARQLKSMLETLHTFFTDCP